MAKGYQITNDDGSTTAPATILLSPNGHRWQQTIDNAGTTTWTDLDA